MSDDTIYTIIQIEKQWEVFIDDSDDAIATFASDAEAIEWCRNRQAHGEVYTAELKPGRALSA